jgi:hypothetical protein
LFLLYCIYISLHATSTEIYCLIDEECIEKDLTNIYTFKLMMVLPSHLERDEKGRFKGKLVPLEPLPENFKAALVGELLGDGHLRFNKKGLDGLPKPNTNVQLAMTLKSKKHVTYLWQEVYRVICSDTLPHPWPNPNTGKPVTQYKKHFSTRTLASLTEIHKQWYILNKETKKFVKIVPLNIGELLTPIGLAHWIMGDGYWDSHGKTIDICTDNFTLSEVELLISVLKEKFSLFCSTKRRIKSNKEVCWRIRFSSKS